MAIPWPSSPVVGDTFTYGGVTYTWNGVAWVSTATTTPGSVGSVAVTAPITNTGTSTAPVIGIDQTGLTIAESQVTNLVTDLANRAKLDTANTFSVGGHIIANSVAGTKPLIVRGAVSQSVNLQEWQTSTPTTVASVSSTGQLASVGLISSGSIQITGSNSPINLPTGNGTSGQFLTSTGSGSTPIWSTPAVGKAIIQTISLSATSSIAFTSIPATYRDLEIHIIGSSATLSSTTLSMTLNGITTGQYSYMNQYIQLTTGTSTTAPSASNGAFQTSIQLTPTAFNPGGSAHLFASLYDYAGSSNKTGTIYYGGALPAATKPIGQGVFTANITAAITSITIAVAGTGGLNGSAVLVGVY